MLWDSRTGELKALLDANRLGQLRTGAVSAVMTDLLAQPGAECLLLIGTGYQAETQALAIARVRHLKTIFVYSRSPAHRLAFAQRIDAQLGGTTAVKPVDTVSAVAAESQIIVTATTSRDPVLQGEWIAPGTHINAVGSNHPTHREIDQEVLRRADLIVTDHMEGARLESGDLLLGLKESEWSRVTSWEQPLSRPSAKAITVFVSQGIASEDLVMAEYVMERWMQTTKAGRVNG
jgi:ornithine cyclodeaminase/alanine dehydrogenase-like protein (mu-crystallin family)